MARYSGQKLLLHLHFNALNIKTHSTRSSTHACGRATLCPSYTQITGSSPAPDINVSSRGQVCTVLWRQRSRDGQALPSTQQVLSQDFRFRREDTDNCALLGSYAASSGNFLPTFRHDLSVPSSGFNITQRIVVIYYRHFATTYRSHPWDSRLRE